MIVYEFPLNERVRTWLRLEDLFDKARFFVEAADPRSHHAALLALFELVEVMARPELKSEMIQELERQKAGLEGLRGNPAVDAQRLDDVLARIAVSLAQLHAINGKPGQSLRENDWLASIRSRTSIPGGACSFDLPGYHYWLNSPASQRAVDLVGWLRPLLPLQAAVDLILKLLRESGVANRHLACAGMFQLMLGGRVAHLLRIGVADERPCAPEVSANKYAVNIRFTVVDKAQKPRTCEQDVGFELELCSLSGCCQ